MQKFLRNAALLLLPLFLYGLTVFMIDPFDYFNHKIVSNHFKKDAKNLNTLLDRTLSYVNEPCRNIILGDSRANNLNLEMISTYTKQDWKKLNNNAAKLNEIIDLFYLAHESHGLNHVIIALNFNMFNQYGYMDRISGVKKLIDQPMMYLYNKDVAEASFYTIKSFFYQNENQGKPKKSKDEFWRWNIETKATHWYKKYKYPKDIAKRLVELDQFALKNGIKINFIITPHHIEFRNRLEFFGLSDEEKTFRDFMKSLNAEVIDFDYKNDMTMNKDNFNDPIHYNDSIGSIITKEFLSGKLLYGIKY